MPKLRSGQEQSILSELAAGSASGLPLETVTDLQQLLTDLLKQRGGTKTALAHDLGISLERLLKVLKNPTESLGVPNLLRLAVVSGLAPGRVLTMAGKADVAELLGLLYGETPGRPVSVEALWPTLSPTAQRALTTFVEEVAKDAIQPVGVSGRRTKSRTKSESVPQRDGPALAETPVADSVQSHSVPLAPPPGDHSLHARLDGKARALEQGKTVDAPARQSGTTRQSTAASRKRKTRVRARGPKRRR